LSSLRIPAIGDGLKSAFRLDADLGPRRRAFFARGSTSKSSSPYRRQPGSDERSERTASSLLGASNESAPDSISTGVGAADRAWPEVLPAARAMAAADGERCAVRRSCEVARARAAARDRVSASGALREPVSAELNALRTRWRSSGFLGPLPLRRRSRVLNPRQSCGNTQRAQCSPGSVTLVRARTRRGADAARRAGSRRSTYGSWTHSLDDLRAAAAGRPCRPLRRRATCPWASSMSRPDRCSMSHFVGTDRQASSIRNGPSQLERRLD